LALSPVSGRAESREEWQQPGRVMGDLAARPGERWADIGCGEGYFTLRLAKAVGPQGAVYGADISERALASLKSQAEQQRLTNVVAVLSANMDTKLAPASVGAALICDVLHEMPAAQRPSVLASAVRALRPGGMLFLIDYRKSRDVTFDPYEKLIPRDELLRLCTEAGLTLDAEFHYLKYQVFFRFRKAEK
jgi:ubiquinone/menaquinone biosynthesis C-methylase UbiE